MTNGMYAHDFWSAMDKLISDSEIIIDRPKGSRHPRFSHIEYPLDYGYLKGTSSMDNSGIDLWRGSLRTPVLDAIIVTVDLMKRDSEIKLLLGMTDEEKQTALAFHNEGIYMKGILISRGEH